MMAPSQLESENTETTPLITPTNHHHSLTRQKKLERNARILGRIFNPLNDAAIAWITLGAFWGFYFAYSDDDIEVPAYIYWSTLGFTNVSSLAFEIINSYRLSKHSRFILGENYYEHTKILSQELTTLLAEHATQNPYQHFEKWVASLKLSSDQETVKKQIRDFETVNRYNHIRKVIEDISVLILGLNALGFFMYKAPLTSIIIITIAAAIMTIMFSMKIWIDRIENNWPQYENRWKKLSLSQKRGLLVLRNLIESLYHFTLGTCVFVLSSDIAVCLFKCSTSSIIPTCAKDLFGSSMLRSYEISMPFAAVYTGIQLISEHRCGGRHSNIFRHIKRGAQGILQGAKVMALLEILCYFFLIKFFSSYGNKAFLFTSAIPLVGGLITTINTILNYQDPDPNKMSTVDHEVSKLREEIVDIKERQLQEQGKKDSSVITVAMHNKSEIVPISKDTFLENTQRSTDRSSLSAFCCFWGRSDSTEDTVRSHTSDNLSETITYQKA